MLLSPVERLIGIGELDPSIEQEEGDQMPTAFRDSFDTDIILDGIRRWVEIETPTEAPDQINRLASLVADGYRDLQASIERIAGQSGYEQMYISSIEPRTRLLYRLYQTLR